MNQQELKNVLELHRKWVLGEDSGSRADLRSADLRSADLRGADLRSANLDGANLRGANLRSANLDGANLRSANLRSANLDGANLRSANLRSANLGGANLRSANLDGADLRGADLRGANLYGANLYGANLYGANLDSADLRGADLRGADLRGADLRGANLRGANLGEIKKDFFKVLDAAKAETLGLYDALQRGRVNGSTYSGECACLVGTIANIRHEKYAHLGIDLRPDSNRPAERWFLAIQQGDIPQSNQVSAITCEWMREWFEANGMKYPRYEIVAVNELTPDSIDGVPV